MEISVALDNLLQFLFETPWLIALAAVGVGGFLAYRVIDLLQAGFVKRQPRPQDLEKLSDEVYTGKRARKVTRAREIFWKGAVTWTVQLAFVGAIPFLVTLVQGWGVSDGWIYYILMGFSFVLNLLLSRLFPLWNPTRPAACRAYERERVLSPANIAFQAWGVISWAVPVFYLWDFFQQNGWIGSILFTLIAQAGQLAVFIYLTKRTAIPYRDYDGLSDEFKEKLHKYLADQGFKDSEVGVLKDSGMGPNAFATGIFGYRHITITEELIAGYPDPSNPDFTLKLGEDTIEAITAHEVGHLRHHHVEKRTLLGYVISSAVTIAVYYLFSGDPSRYGFEDGTSTQLLLYWGQSLFNIFLTYPLTFTMLSMSRSSETQADTHLLKTHGCHNGQDFFHQIRHIAPVPNSLAWHVTNDTHPQPKVREDRLRAWAKANC